MTFIDMERINTLKNIIDNMLSDSYSYQYQYHIADFVGRGNPHTDAEMDKLASESEFLQKISKEVREYIKNKLCTFVKNSFKMIDVTKFMADHNLDKKEVARAMFPENSYPGMAFKRITDGDGLLDSDQIVRLAAMAKVSVAELFNGSWASKSTVKSFVLEKGDYRAELDWASWITRIFHKESKFHEQVLTQPTIPMSKYIEEIEEIISKHEFE